MLLTATVCYKAYQINQQAVAQELAHEGTTNFNFLKELFVQIDNTMTALNSVISSLHRLPQDSRDLAVKESLAKLNLETVSAVLHHVVYLSRSPSTSENIDQPHPNWRFVSDVSKNGSHLWPIYRNVPDLFERAESGEPFTFSSQWEGADSTYGFFVYPVEHAGHVDGVLVASTKFVDNGFAIVEAYQASLAGVLPKVLIEITHLDGTCIAVWDLAAKKPYSCVGASSLINNTIKFQAGVENFFGSSAIYHSTPAFYQEYQYFEVEFIAFMGVLFSVFLGFAVFSLFAEKKHAKLEFTRVQKLLPGSTGFMASILLCGAFYIEDSSYGSQINALRANLSHQDYHHLLSLAGFTSPWRWLVIVSIGLIVGLIVHHFLRQRVDLEGLFKEQSETLIALKRSEDVKSRFLSNMSHELRTPLNSIYGMAQIIATQTHDESIAGFAQRINESCASLTGIFEQFTDVNKLQHGLATFEPSACDVVALAKEVGAIFAPTAYQKGLEYAVPRYSQKPVISVDTDRYKLQTVLINLLSNAVRFTEQGAISLDIEYGPNDDIIFTLIDTGPGISEADQKRIFEMFTQVDESFTREHGGIGAGLFLVSGFVKLMNGEIHCESSSGHGCQFTVKIPSARLKNKPIHNTHIDANVNGVTSV